MVRVEVGGLWEGGRLGGCVGVRVREEAYREAPYTTRVCLGKERHWGLSFSSRNSGSLRQGVICLDALLLVSKDDC